MTRQEFLDKEGLIAFWKAVKGYIEKNGGSGSGSGSESGGTNIPAGSYGQLLKCAGGTAVAWISGDIGSASRPIFIRSGGPVECDGVLDVDISGLARRASILNTARTISLTGAVTGSGSFNGGSDLTINTVLSNNYTALTEAEIDDYIAAAES